VSSSSGDEVPHILIRKPRVRLGKISISSAKRLLQQYLPGADSPLLRGAGPLNDSLSTGSRSGLTPLRTREPLFTSDVVSCDVDFSTDS